MDGKKGAGITGKAGTEDRIKRSEEISGWW
jgi:hypothetical protein